MPHEMSSTLVRSSSVHQINPSSSSRRIQSGRLISTLKPSNMSLFGKKKSLNLETEKVSKYRE